MHFSEVWFFGGSVVDFFSLPYFQLEAEIFVKVDIAPLLTSLNYVWKISLSVNYEKVFYF